MRVMLDKDFEKDLEIFSEKLITAENFAFVRFSDGEADILRNMKLVISDDYVIEGDFTHNFGYSKEDHNSVAHPVTKCRRPTSILSTLIGH